jgi:glycosyltransferase involved in cell wall biosynthesis
MALKQLVIIVPAYNEADKIGATIAALLEVRDGLLAEKVETRIFVIDDGSRDDTGQLAIAAGADKVLVHRRNRGLGAAVRTGLFAAAESGADVAVKFDADLQHDPGDIRALLAPILDGKAEVVYGSRFEQIAYRMPLVRRLGNLFFTQLMRWLTGWDLRDSQPGIFAVDRAYLDVTSLPGDYNYTQQILMDAYLKGMRFAQVPVQFRARTTGTSFVSLRYPLKVLPQILLVLMQVKPLKVFGILGLAFLAVAVAVGGVEMILWLFFGAEKPVQHVNLVLGTALFGLQILFFGLLAQLIVALHLSTQRGRNVRAWLSAELVKEEPEGESTAATRIHAVRGAGDDR